MFGFKASLIELRYCYFLWNNPISYINHKLDHRSLEIRATLRASNTELCYKMCTLEKKPLTNFK